jgi:3-oxo-5-alpha-steroid 4-dehydrogenase 1
MNEAKIFDLLIIIWFSLAAIVFVSLFFFTAPYGRHARRGWGQALNDRLSWIIMESAAPLLFLVLFFIGPYNRSPVSLVFLIMWELHYVHRAFIFPFTIRSSAPKMTLTVIIMGFVFNSANAYINGRYLFNFSGGYENTWIKDPRFITGLFIFILGFVINRQSDLLLRNLRQAGETAYKIPYGGLFHWVTCPNYFGEIMIWAGWAVMTWSPAGAAFAVWTAANLIPRARSHQKWYLEHFPDYPPERKTLIPGIW